MDTVTRTVKVRHIIQAVDVGTPINPEVVRGQVEGGDFHGGRVCA